MKGKLNLVLGIASLFLFCFNINAQEEPIKGIGFISPEIILSDEVYDMNVKDKEIKLYIAPNLFSGDRIIQRRRTGKLSEYFETVFVDTEGNEDYLKPRSTHTVWTGYKSHSLQYYTLHDGFYKVVVNEQVYWLNQAEMQEMGFEHQSWQEYYQGTDSKALTANYNLNLRTAPDSEAEKIILLTINRYNKEFYHQLQMTGNFQGNWAEVEVSIYESMDARCRSKQVEKKLKGWIKYLDDSGYPNIYYIPTPCC